MLARGRLERMNRKVRIEYDCPACGMRAAHTERRETDKSDEELKRIFARPECPNRKCKSRGGLQDWPVSRIVPE